MHTTAACSRQLLLITSLLCLASSGRAELSAFESVRLPGDVTIELPRHWTNLDKGRASDMNASSEVIAQSSGVHISQGNNQILLARNSYDSHGRTIATARVSVRTEETVSQADARELGALPPAAELYKVFQPAIDASMKAMRSLRDVSAVEASDWKLANNGVLTCMYFEFRVTWHKRPRALNQTWVLPLKK